MCKGGFAGDDAPRSVIPSIVGLPKYPHEMQGTHKVDCYVGDEAQSRRGILSIRYPLEHGVVVNWDDLEKLLHQSFYNELRIDPSDHEILLTDAPFNPKSNREKLIQMIFEQFNFNGFHTTLQGILSIYSSGRGSGVVVVSDFLLSFFKFSYLFLNFFLQIVSQIF